MDYMNYKRIFLLAFVLFLVIILSAPPSYASHQAIGRISFVHGINYAGQSNATQRVLANDSDLFTNDIIETSERSQIIIKFNDGARVSVHANSKFAVNQYDSDSQSITKSAKLNLIQGGFDMVTGAIARDNPENFQITTPKGILHPKYGKSEFTVRICNEDCERKDSNIQEKTARTEKSPVARVVEIKGNVFATNKTNNKAIQRELLLGSSIYNADTIRTETESYALLIFIDGEKVTLESSSEMNIDQYYYKIKEKRDSILFRLVIGGLRALSGLIAKEDHSAFSLQTPVATIGIRGTGTDSYVKDNTLEHSTWAGISFILNQAGEFDIHEGKTSVTSGPNATPQIFPTSTYATQHSGPRPDSDKTDPEKLFQLKSDSDKDVNLKAKTGDLIIDTYNGNSINIKEDQNVNINSNGELISPNQSSNNIYHKNKSNTDTTVDNRNMNTIFKILLILIVVSLPIIFKF